MPLRLLTAPDLEPVSIEDLKLHLRVTQDDEDSLIEALGAAAREDLENETGRVFMVQEWALTLHAFPCGAIVMPKPPLVGVSEITYIDTNGDEQTLSTSLYTVHNAYDATDAAAELTPPHAEPGYIVPAYQQVWPQTRDQPDAVTVTFQCGYGETPEWVPKALIAAVKIRTADLFNAQRESQVVGTIVAPTNALLPLVYPFKTVFAS